MYKLVILVDELEDPLAFNDAWPGFLRLAESMPGLKRESFSRVQTVLFGQTNPSLMHELYFDSLEATRLAMSSSAGREAGRLLQQITGGRVTLFLADHKVDSLENIRKYAAAKNP